MTKNSGKKKKKHIGVKLTCKHNWVRGWICLTCRATELEPEFVRAIGKWVSGNNYVLHEDIKYPYE